MAQVSALQSLDLILEDVSAEINLSINALDHYSRSPEKSKGIGKCLSHLSKLKGVFTLLEMHGAQRLISECIKLAESLAKRNQQAQKRLLNVISTALARLMRYTEHVNQKPADLPQLLLPTINFLRAAVKDAPLGESAFFECDTIRQRANKDLVLITSEETGIQSRHYRKMYQIGLIEVIRQTNLSGGLNMMRKAMQKLDEECARPNCPNLWWIADCLLLAFAEKGLTLTRARLKLFSRLDRQIRKIENKSENRVDNNKLEMNSLAREMLYLIWICGVDNLQISELLSHFELSKAPLNDAELRKELDELRGPSDQDYHSIAEALVEEIRSIELILSEDEDAEKSGVDLAQAIKQMKNLNSLLKVLQVDDQIVRLGVAIDLIEKAITKENHLEEKDANILFIVLESIRNSVEQSELAKYSGKRAMRREKLSQAQAAICEQTHRQIKQLIAQFTQFSQNKRKALLLKNSDTLLKQIQSGFEQLKVTDAIPVLEGCQVFINHHLIKNPHTTSETVINLFADVVGGLEFYLETLAFTAKPSPRILEFSESSLLQLNRLIRKN